MHDHLVSLAAQSSWLTLAVTMVIAIMILGKSADWLVDEAVLISKRSNVSPMLIGATIVSMGTTLPEAVVSVLAATQGNPGLALGNAVGSVIADTGLILGISILLGSIPIDKKLVNRQGWIQVGAGFLLVLFVFPWNQPSNALISGGNLSQASGGFFLSLLALYLFFSLKWAKEEEEEEEEGDYNSSLEEDEERSPSSTAFVILKLGCAIGLVVLSSEGLITTATESAIRLSVPSSVIAATLVAFGTSLPELVTCVTAVRKNQGALALGNVIGADILNILFVTGAAAAVTTGGLDANPHFFEALFPAMLTILIIFRLGIMFAKGSLGKGFGVLLILCYVVVTVASYN
jgi:cation:H+ antiporter